MKITLVLLPGLHGTEGLFEPLVKGAPDDIDILAIEYPPHEKIPYEKLTTIVGDKLKSIEGSYIILGESFAGPLSLFIAET